MDSNYKTPDTSDLTPLRALSFMAEVFGIGIIGRFDDYSLFLGIPFYVGGRITNQLLSREINKRDLASAVENLVSENKSNQNA